jgi:hypothetical protein
VPPHQEPVTVVIPLYNKAGSIERAVDSVFRQTWRNIELIVIDDGSEDGGAERVAQRPDSRLRLIRQANGGPGLARNVGWRLGHGEIVAFLDADDYWEPGYLEWSVGVLRRDPSLAACISSFREIRGARRIVDMQAVWRSKGIREGRVAIGPDSTVAELRTLLSFMFPQSTVTRRDVLERFSGFYERDRCSYGEDSFLWLRVLLTAPVYTSLESRLAIDRTESALSNLATLASRSIEPMLTEPSELRRITPPELQPLLEGLLAERAYKRACTLAAVGRWRRAADLRREFAQPGAVYSLYGLASLLLANPVGGAATGLLLRAWRAFGTTR